MRGEEVGVVMPLASPRSPHCRSGSGSVEWHGSPWRSNGVFVVENGLRWTRSARGESVVRALLIEISAFSHSGSRVGWCEFSARMLSSFVPPMLHSWQYLAFGNPIASQFIGNTHTRRILEPFKELDPAGKPTSQAQLERDFGHSTSMKRGF